MSHRPAFEWRTASIRLGHARVDSSGNNLTATPWARRGRQGRFGGAASLDGVSDRIDVPALGTFYKTGFTYEAWVRKSTAKKDVALLGTWAVSRRADDLGRSQRRPLLPDARWEHLLAISTRAEPAVGQWEHVAATYDGSVARFYVDGVEVATTFTGHVGSSNTWRLGAFDTTPTGFFDGLVDNVRVYDRALSSSEIQTDMASRIQPESIPPTVTATTPADGATGDQRRQLGDGHVQRAHEGEHDHDVVVPAEDARGRRARHRDLRLNHEDGEADPAKHAGLRRAVLGHRQGRSRRRQRCRGKHARLERQLVVHGRSFSPQLLVVTSTAKPFGSYLGEILRNEGLNAFTTIDVAFLSPALLSRIRRRPARRDAAERTQVSTVTGWVNGGGNLIAMRPDKQLAGLLGLTVASGTRSNAYLSVDTTVPPGTGIVGATMQYHGTADRYTLSGATSVATQYSNATTVTTNPAVTLRSVGTNGGQAAAFTYDLARSVVYTRQGNPAWAGQERDGVAGSARRPFYGARAGDVQPDWIDTTRSRSRRPTNSSGCC